MSWDQVRFPGHEVLHARVSERCGDAEERFLAYGHHFGDWIDDGPGAALSTVTRVETAIAEHLRVAARVGKGWGTVVGVVLGLVGSLVATLAIWALS